MAARPKAPQKGARISEQQLLSMLEQLSQQMGTRGTRLGCCRCCKCCNCSKRPRSAQPKARAKSKSNSNGSKAKTSALSSAKRAESHAALPGAALREPLALRPTEAPEKVPEPKKPKPKDPKPRRGQSLLEELRSFPGQDKTPSPRPPRGQRNLLSVPSAPLRVEVRPRRRTTSRPVRGRTTSAPKERPQPMEPVAFSPAARPAEPATAQGRGRGRRSSRNLLAELYQPKEAPSISFDGRSSGHFREPVTFVPPPRAEPLAAPPPLREPTMAPPPAPAREPVAREAARQTEIFYEPDRGEVCPSCSRTFTQDSIFCRHCGSRRSAQVPQASRESQNEPLNLDSATRQLEQLVQDTHQALIRDGIIGESEAPQSTPSLDAVDRALEELQRGLQEIDHVLAKPMPEPPK